MYSEEEAKEKKKLKKTCFSRLRVEAWLKN